MGGQLLCRSGVEGAWRDAIQVDAVRDGGSVHKLHERGIQPRWCPGTGATNEEAVEYEWQRLSVIHPPVNRQL